MDSILDPDLLQPPRRPKIRRFVLAGVVVMLFLALGVAGAMSEYQRTLVARSNVMRSYDRRMVVADLLSRLKDAENAQRGYIITGRPEFMAPYGPAMADVARYRRTLAARLAEGPRQAGRYAALNQAIDAELVELNGIATVGAARGTPSARNRMDVGGPDRMNRVRAIGAAVIAEEDRMIAGWVAQDDRRIAKVKRQLTALVIVLATLSALVLTREWRGRRSRYRLERRAHAAAVRLRGVFTATSDAVALIDPHGVIQAVNPAVEQLVGRPPADVIGKDISVLVDAVPAGGTFPERLGLADGRLRETFRIDRVAYHVEGHSVPVDVALGLMPVPSGTHMVAAIRDVSERKRIDRIKDEFVATVSHELRTPLTSIVGALGLLRGTAITLLPEGAQRLVRVAEENSQRLIDLINDLLDIERMEAGGLRFRDEPLDLADVLRQAAHRSEGLAATRNVRIELKIASGVIAVRGDEGRLAQVVTNLLANAIRFSPADAAVTIAAERRGGRAVVTVSDRGPGVPEAFRDQLFTRFAQSETGGRAVGTGLGLAISRQIMRAHGGAIWFEPHEGGGARFGFAVNLVIGGSVTPHMLICADRPAVVCGLRRLADGGACSADVVATVADARAAIHSGNYDAVLIDLDGEDSTGAALLTGLSHEALDGDLPVPVIARSGGVVRLGTRVDRASWDAFESGDGALAARMRALLDGIGATRPLIIHVDGDAAMIERTAGKLQRRARLRCAPDLATATVLLEREHPALLILDQDVSDGTTSKLPDWLKAQAAQGGLARVATILYTARPVTQEVERLVDCVVTKSQRSAPNLIAAVDRLLARAGLDHVPVRHDDDHADGQGDAYHEPEPFRLAAGNGGGGR